MSVDGETNPADDAFHQLQHEETLKKRIPHDSEPYRPAVVLAVAEGTKIEKVLKEPRGLLGPDSGIANGIRVYLEHPAQRP
jgi:hypothetical protein